MAEILLKPRLLSLKEKTPQENSSFLFLKIWGKKEKKRQEQNAAKLNVETLVMISHCFTLYLPQMCELKGVRMERISDESGILYNVELMASSHELINGWGSSPY